MKLRITTLIVLLASVGFIIGGSFFNPAYTTINGAPSARCGSVAHTSTCSSCHSGPNTVQPGWITSTIPSSGYVPGTTYTITATATYAGRSTFGFEVTCENSMGTKKGTFIASSTTQLLSSGVYVTHKSSSISGAANSHTWTFTWTAPAAGTGSVTFFGAFLCADGDGSESGDITYKANLPVAENITTGIADNNLSLAASVSVYPNPTSEFLNVSYRVDHQSNVVIELYDINGNLVREFINEEKSAGTYNHSFSDLSTLAKGTYLLNVTVDHNRSVKKVLFQ